MPNDPLAPDPMKYVAPQPSTRAPFRATDPAPFIPSQVGKPLDMQHPSGPVTFKPLPNGGPDKRAFIPSPPGTPQRSDGSNPSYADRDAGNAPVNVPQLADGSPPLPSGPIGAPATALPKSG